MGMSKIAVQNKITLIEDVAEYLHAKVGEKIIFYKNLKSGKIEIERSRNDDT